MPTASVLESLWIQRGIRVDQLDVRSDGTVAPRTDPDPSGASAEAALRYASDLPSGANEIEPLAELGRGGMGVVHLARQHSLRRDVALKRALVLGRGDVDLVEEARALAYLAHPNVAPVHALVTIDERPALVMKRISGTLWSTLLEQWRAEPETTDGTGLESHLAILIEVTRAVEHAHRSGVLHLDVKPANVMLGAFGEVYLLDWGLAARIGPEPAHLRAAGAIDAPAGTTAYMAPEQALGDGAHIDVRTDVYLLGATLHDLLTGLPRNAGQAPSQQLLAAAIGTPPAFPDGIPPALVDVVNRATAHSPTERFPDVVAFRAALVAYLQNRQVDVLVDRARAGLEALHEALAAASPDRERVHHHFGAVRFSAREVVSLAPGRTGVEALMLTTYAAMARYALREGELDLAAAYIAELTEPDAALLADLAAARADESSHRQHVRRLEQLGRSQDLSIEHRLRGLTVFGLGLGFAACNFALGYIDRSGHPVSYGGVAMAIGLAASIITPYGIVRRRELFPNRVAAAIWGTSISTGASVAAHLLLCWTLGVPFHAALVLTTLHYMLCFGALATLIDARVWPAAIFQVPALLLAAIHPAWAFEIIGIGTALSIGYIGWVWSELRG